MYGDDDLPVLLIPPAESPGLRYAQAVILTWNPSNFTGSVQWEGVTIPDVPVLASVQALGFVPDDVVGMLGWNPGGGVGSWWIIGKLALPGVDSPDLVVRGSSLIVDGGLLVIEGGGSQIIRDGGNLDVESGGDINVTGGAVNVTGDFGVVVSGGGDILIDSGGGILVENGGDIAVDDDGEIRVTSTSFGREVALLNGGIGFYNPTTADLRFNCYYDEVNDSFLLRSDEGIRFTTDATSGTHFFDSNTSRLAHGTTGSSANAHLSLNGTLSRSTSSRRYKQDIADVEIDPAPVRQLRSRTWRDKAEVEADPETERWYVGLIAEEVDELGLGQFVEYDDEGRPESISYDRLSVALLAVVKDQERRLSAIEARLAA